MATYDEYFTAKLPEKLRDTQCMLISYHVCLFYIQVSLHFVIIGVIDNFVFSTNIHYIQTYAYIHSYIHTYMRTYIHNTYVRIIDLVFIFEVNLKNCFVQHRHVRMPFTDTFLHVFFPVPSVLHHYNA